ncbi:DUF501 domain-containing protein [Natronoglycomyces albus]|uniref:DUF501 domain-containing protein n=1 Tax=Natronoglycomyces albus TaxID=2811108 RepID=A0A895XFE9_9ACTN|nr:DUF501 domain-containing protein [Natronoglycomyces albus]QSB04571.1 DUF501 domain-containing protein [Natronoglycomyces albus]
MTDFHRNQQPQDVTDADAEAVRQQLGRPIRGANAVAWRCPCGKPGVIETEPRLPDGTPFPTLYYLTCPKACSAIGTLEGSGQMKRMSQRLSEDPELAESYRRAHEAYLQRRSQLGDVPEIDGISAGGMPDRVKCLHVHVGHALASPEGLNRFGEEALEQLDAWWQNGSCVSDEE